LLCGWGLDQCILGCKYMITKVINGMIEEVMHFFEKECGFIKYFKNSHLHILWFVMVRIVREGTNMDLHFVLIVACIAC